MSIDRTRLVLLTALTSSASAATLYVTVGRITGGSAGLVCVAAGIAIAYALLTFPKRELRARERSQAREAPSLASGAAAGYRTTGSRVKTMLMLESHERRTRLALVRAKRSLLLGRGVREAVGDATSTLESTSVVRVLNSIGSLGIGVASEHAAESESFAAEAELVEETRLPIFTTFAFFTPIMLVLFMVTSHQTDSASVIQAVLLQGVVLEIALHLSSREG
jgi:hypothetical protein